MPQRDWSWLPSTSAVIFTPPVQEERLPASVKAQGNPTDCLDRGEMVLMSALRLWPRGTTSSALATNLAMPRSEVSRGLRQLRAKSLVVRSYETPPDRWSYSRAVFWSLADAERTAELMPSLPVASHAEPAPMTDSGVPAQFWHVFCSGADPSRLRFPEDGVLIARRLLESLEAEARSWALTRIDVEQLEECLAWYPNPGSEVPTLIRQALQARQ